MADTLVALLEDLASDTEGGHRYRLPKATIDRSYHEIVARADRLGAGLVAKNAKPGDRVGLILHDPETFVACFFACIRQGLVAVPLYPPLAMGRLDGWVEDTARILRTAQARLLVTTPDVARVAYSLVDLVDGLGELIDPASLEAPAVPPAQVGPDDLAFLQFTSGSTADPKGVMVTHRCLMANAEAIMTGLGDGPGDRGVSWLPLYHDMGLIGFVIAPLVRRVPVTFLRTVDFLKRPKRWLQAIDEDRGTITFAPNFALAITARRVTPEPGWDLSCLRVLGCGAEPIHVDVAQRFVETFAHVGLKDVIMPAYGLAEATLAVTFAEPGQGLQIDRVERDQYLGQGRAKPHEQGFAFVSCGFALQHVEVSVVDEHDQVLPPRHVGEIVVRGPGVTPGYWQNPDHAAFENGGLRTGDLGYLAEDQLYVTGRKKDVLIVNGRNLDPGPIESAVAACEGIREGNVAAFAVQGEQSEGIVVVAECRSGGEEMVPVVASVVHKTVGIDPQDVVLLAPGQLPKTTSGKLRRAETRSQYLDGTLGQTGSRLPGSKGSTFVLGRHLARSAVARIRKKTQGSN